MAVSATNDLTPKGGTHPLSPCTVAFTVTQQRIPFLNNRDSETSPGSSCTNDSADTDPPHDENSEVGQLQTGWREELQQRHALMQPGVMKMASVLGKDAADGTSQSTGEVLWLRARQPRGKELSHERSTETRLVGKRNSHVFSHFHKDTNSSAAAGFSV